jgi:hypothetical protein
VIEKLKRSQALGTQGTSIERRIRVSLYFGDLSTSQVHQNATISKTYGARCPDYFRLSHDYLLYSIKM